ncbi:hypothetical protein Acr_23g0010930 [Actinidia rufa]|uniref:Uncharacterized protein n=1 Tax=Actinidia rufa TaxID=165716 RepID=A0A7J0GPN3_9ERIC|nr:hypothetical protein Acr_23g0010930 [Actinidia rufa]
MALWRVYKYSISLSEFRNLFSLNSNPKPDQGWLYFKARNKEVLLGGYPSNVKGWKSKFFFVSGDEWEIPEGTSRKGAPRVSRTWGIPGRSLFSFYPVFVLLTTRSVEQSGRFSVPVLLDSKSYRRVFVSPGSRASRTAGDNLPSREAPSSSSDVGWAGGKVLDPILDHFLNAPSSNPSSESCSNSSLPIELESDDWREAREDGGCELGDSRSGEGVVIGEKRAGESITSSPSKKGKADDGSKGKGVDSGPEGKKKATSSSKASAAPTVAAARPREGTSAHLGIVLGPPPSILGSPSVAERLLRGVIPPADKEKVDKLTLDQTATKLFHMIGQALVLGSSLAVRRREGWGAGISSGGQLAESRARKQQANHELAKMKSDRDSLTDKVERSGLLVNELREALNKSQGVYRGGVQILVQLRRHHPDLTIDLEGTVVDQDLLAEQDEAADEREKENLGENKGLIGLPFARPGRQEGMIGVCPLIDYSIWRLGIFLKLGTPISTGMTDSVPKTMEYGVSPVGIRLVDGTIGYFNLPISLGMTGRGEMMGDGEIRTK